MVTVRILGIDPGSRLTGFGCIDLVGNQLVHVAHGTLRLSNTGGKAVIPLEQRLHSIHLGLTDVIAAHRPRIMVVEKVFFAKNAVSALKLGQARGAVILSGMIHGLEIVEYSPSEVKQTVVGQGHADKEQVAKMVERLIGKREFATADASDALALAICHAYRATLVATRGVEFARALGAASGQRSKRRASLAEALGVTPESVAGQKRVRLRT